MKLTEVQFGALAPVDGYGPGFFRVGGKVFEGNVLTDGTLVTTWAGFDDISALLALAGKVDVIFCGMGADIRHLPRETREALEEAGLGIEVMSTSAAARTYNVCLSEGRRVAAALLAV